MRHMRHPPFVLYNLSPSDQMACSENKRRVDCSNEVHGVHLSFHTFCVRPVVKGWARHVMLRCIGTVMYYPFLQDKQHVSNLFRDFPWCPNSFRLPAGRKPTVLRPTAFSCSLIPPPTATAKRRASTLLLRLLGYESFVHVRR